MWSKNGGIVLMIKTQSYVLWAKRLLCAIALTFNTTAVISQSNEFSNSAFRVSGFGTLGITNTSAPDGWGYRRDISQPNNDGGTRADIDSRLGIQVNYAPTPQFEMVAQLVAANMSDYAPLSDSIRWAFIAYRPRPDVTIRLGRLNIDTFLLADYRDVGFAYNFARPPVDFYGSLPLSLDGFDIIKDLQFDNSRWRLKAFAGWSNGGDLSIDSRVVVEPVYGITVSRESGGLTLSAGVAYAGLSENATVLQPLIDGLDDMGDIPIPEISEQAMALQARLDSADDYALYQSFGINYELRDWQLSMELMRVSGHPTARLSAGYASVARRFGEVTIFSSISRIYTPNLPVSTPDWATNLAPIFGPDAAQQAQTLASSAAYAVNSSGAKQQTLSLGGRWDFRSNMALKVQWDYISIDTNGGRLWSNSSLESGYANVASIMLDFIF